MDKVGSRELLYSKVVIAQPDEEIVLALTESDIPTLKFKIIITQKPDFPKGTANFSGGGGEVTVTMSMKDSPFAQGLGPVRFATEGEINVGYYFSISALRLGTPGGVQVVLNIFRDLN